MEERGDLVAWEEDAVFAGVLVVVGFGDGYDVWRRVDFLPDHELQLGGEAGENREGGEWLRGT